jgi:hypothetical protein
VVGIVFSGDNVIWMSTARYLMTANYKTATTSSVAASSQLPPEILADVPTCLSFYNGKCYSGDMAREIDVTLCGATVGWSNDMTFSANIRAIAISNNYLFASMASNSFIRTDSSVPFATTSPVNALLAYNNRLYIGETGKISVWDAVNTQLLRTISLSNATSVVRNLTADGQWLVVGTSVPSVIIYDIATDAQLKEIFVTTQITGLVSGYPYIYVGQVTSVIKLDYRNNDFVDFDKGNAVRFLAMPDGDNLFIGNNNGQLRHWTIDTPKTSTTGTSTSTSTRTSTSTSTSMSTSTKTSTSTSFTINNRVSVISGTMTTPMNLVDDSSNPDNPTKAIDNTVLPYYINLMIICGAGIVLMLPPILAMLYMRRLTLQYERKSQGFELQAVSSTSQQQLISRSQANLF